MSDPRREAVGWKDLPRERQRRLVVLIGKLIRQRLAAPLNAAETADEPDPVECRVPCVRQDPASPPAAAGGCLCPPVDAPSGPAARGV